MTEGENLDAKLEVYLSLLDVTPATKHIHRKAISGFFPLLYANGRTIPCDEDYDSYCYDLWIRQKKSISLGQDYIRYAQRFFSWLGENPNCTSLETVQKPPLQRPRRKRSRKVSTKLSACLYESLAMLAANDGTDIPTMLNAIVAKYVAHRKAVAGNL